MNAVVIRQHGGREVLHLEDVPRPTPGRGEALVRVAAVGLNRMDIFTRQGLNGPGVRAVHLPHVPGGEFAGTVVELGTPPDDVVPPPGEARYAGPIEPGDRVVAYPGLSCGRCRYCRAGETSLCKEYRIFGEDVWGAMAEYVTIPRANLLRLPDHVPLTEAAAAPVALTTAWRMLMTVAGLRLGETVLIIGASGGVATAALQIAAAAGAKVIAATRSSEKEARLRQLGVERVIDYAQPGWSAQVISATDGEGVQVVVDAIGAPTWRESIRSLAPGGRMVICGATGGDQPEISIRELYQSQRQILGAPMGGWNDFVQAMDTFFSGRIHPVIDRELPLQAIGEAHRRMEEQQHFGKIVLRVSDER